MGSGCSATASTSLWSPNYDARSPNSITTLKSGDTQDAGRRSNSFRGVIGGQTCRATSDSTVSHAIYVFEQRPKNANLSANFIHSQFLKRDGTSLVSISSSNSPRPMVLTLRWSSWTRRVNGRISFLLTPPLRLWARPDSTSNTSGNCIALRSRCCPIEDLSSSPNLCANCIDYWESPSRPRPPITHSPMAKQNVSTRNSNNTFEFS